MFKFVVDLFYSLFGITRTVEESVEKDNTIGAAGEYLEVEDEVKTIEKTVEKETSSSIKKQDQKISI